MNLVSKMGSLERKLQRKDEKARAKYLQDIKSEATKIASRAIDRTYQDAYEEASEVAMAKVLAVAAEIIHNDWGKLSRKDTRLKVFVNLMSEKLQQVDNPSDQQIEVERLLAEQCGVKFGRIGK